MLDTVLKPNGSLTIPLGWRGGFQTLKFTGGPYDAFPGRDAAFGVCVRAERVNQSNVDVHLPIRDFGVPASAVRVEDALRDTLMAALKGREVYVGCMGGWGRTGLFLALLAKACGVEDPVGFVRSNYSSRAVETDAQVDYVENFDTAALQSWLRSAGWGKWFADVFFWWC